VQATTPTLPLVGRIGRDVETGVHASLFERIGVRPRVATKASTAVSAVSEFAAIRLRFMALSLSPETEARQNQDSPL